ncbi:putative thioredoxin-like protein [Lupinus albus]|uniref:Putative thioredoxin-like protein n=1 Tax=Lupinus albus TaxID=3870 RepID=A0A6A4NMV6_LUPAL|nr:putative thioredoxin-like protein [Lupinus albus]
MGCVSSKHVKKEHVTFNNGGFNHVVSLTSSTLGALNLDNHQQPIFTETTTIASESKFALVHGGEEDPEVINAWELMEGLEEGVPISNELKKTPKLSPFLRGLINTPDKRSSPLKSFNQFGSPKSMRKFSGKENKNKVQVNGGRGMRCLDYNYSPKGVLKESNSCPSTCKSVLKLSNLKVSPRNNFGSDSLRNKSDSPLFDPDLVASYEKELSIEEEEHIKRMVWATPKATRVRKAIGSETFLQKFEMKCPKGGENCVVIYTTTLRGIRKTFEDCNKVRAIVESFNVHVVERDVSMHSGFKEELRKLMGTKEVKVPVMFVKGKFVGGVEEVMKLEEDEKLSVLFEGIPKALGECKWCGDVRFVMCMECNGSCKVLDEDKNKSVRCGQCNENGIIQCPICSSC